MQAAQFSWWTAVVIPGVSALLGGGLATYLALYRQRRERAFERRLEWYERMHSVLMESRHAVLDAVHRAEVEPASFDRVGDIINYQLREIRTLRSFADVYGTPAVYNAINEVFDTMQGELAQAHDEKLRLMPEEYLRLAKSQVNAFIRAAVVLAKEIRQHLQLEPLADHERMRAGVKK